MRAVVFAYSNVGDRCLRVLAARDVEVALVITHRDNPAETLWFARVADTARELGMPTAYADDLDQAGLVERVAQARPQAIFSFYYRHMLPAAVLELAPGKAFNMHGSLLPNYRGRAPTNWAVLRGETETGATLHEMVARPDAGFITDQSAVPILPDDTAQQVFEKVTVAAEQVLWRSLPAIMTGTQPRLPNETALGSYFSGRRPEDGRIDWAKPAHEVYNLIRAVAPPYPGAFTDFGDTRLVVAVARRLPADAVPGLSGLPPGLHVLDGNIYGICAAGNPIRVLDLRANGVAIGACALGALIEQQRREIGK